MDTFELVDGAALALHWHHHGATRVVDLSERFVELVSELDEEELARPVPDLDWTVIDVVAHVATVWRRYTVDPARAATWHDVAVANAADIVAIGHDTEPLLEEIMTHTSLMAMAPATLEPDALRPFHAGQSLTLAGAWGNAVNELLVHGDDVARATGRTWRVEAADLEPFWRYTTSVMPGFMTARGRAAHDRWTLDLGFASGPVRLRFDGGALHVDEPGEWRPDHVVSGDAALVTLAMPWRRRPPSSASVAEFASRIEPV
jgi:uncharacterized protein (TIGR03083 family)